MHYVRATQNASLLYERVMSHWLQHFLKQSGLTPSELARRAQTSRQNVNRWLHGPLPPERARELAPHLGVTAAELLFGPDQKMSKLNGSPQSSQRGPTPQLPSNGHPVRYLSVVGEVAAGRWLDVSALDFAPYEEAVPVDHRWPADAVHGYVIRGASLNKRAHDGDIATVVSFEAFGRDIRAGDFVLVERTRQSTHQVELSIKLVGRTPDGRWQLLPYSTDPRHQEPLALGEHEDETVRVLGFATNFVSIATRP